MGFFSGLGTFFRKSEAAGLVQRFLTMQLDAGTRAADPARLARQLVRTLWNTKPELFGTPSGLRPDKISVAAAALAFGILGEEDEHTQARCVPRLGQVLAEIEANAALYPFNAMDRQLLDGATGSTARREGAITSRVVVRSRCHRIEFASSPPAGEGWGEGPGIIGPWPRLLARTLTLPSRCARRPLPPPQAGRGATEGDS